MYIRKCDCGKEIVYKKKDSWKKAISNNSMCPSCRTIQNNKLPHRAKKGSNNPAWKGYKDIPGKTLSRLKRGAEQRNLCFEITLEDIQNALEKQNHKCALTGWDVTFGVNASVDRIDSTKGYTVDNIQIVDKRINIMKRDFNEKFFINACKAVVLTSKD
jgi:uncharacterized protein with von Willebrand factor type A (vWA) domain